MIVREHAEQLEEQEKDLTCLIHALRNCIRYPDEQLFQSLIIQAIKIGGVDAFAPHEKNEKNKKIGFKSKP